MTDPNDRAFDIYKQYASATESLGDRRRGYTSILLPVQTALLVAPYFLEIANSTPKFMLVVASALIGILVSAFWGTMSKRYRHAIVFRYAWLAAMELFLRNRKAIPNFARVYSFESAALFASKPSFSPSKVEIRAALIFVSFFALNPLVYSLSSDKLSYVELAVAVIWGVAAHVVALILWNVMDDFNIVDDFKSRPNASTVRAAFNRVINLDTPDNHLLGSVKQDILEGLDSELEDVGDVELKEKLVSILQINRKPTEG